MNSYRAIISQFPAMATIKPGKDQCGEYLAIRIAAEARMSVMSDMDHIGKLATANGAVWLRWFGPTQWGDRWITHGEMRSAHE